MDRVLKISIPGLSGKSARLPGKPDVMAGLATSIANVPDGMALGALADVNPIYSIYTLMIGMPLAALTASTQLMMFNTTSAMTLGATDGLGDRTGDEHVQALIAGVFQLTLG